MAADEVLELVVAGDEVRLGVDLDERALRARGGDADQALGGDAVRLLLGLDDALLAQPVDGRIRCRPWSRPVRSCNRDMPAPERSRSSLTRAAVISAMGWSSRNGVISDR